MSIYKLTAVEQGDTFTTEHGQFQAWTVHVLPEDVDAQLNTKVGSGKAPEVGEEIDGTLSKGPRGWKLKRAFNAGTNPRKGGYEEWPPAHERDPSKNAAIIRTSAIKAAIDLLAVEVAAGIPMGETKASDLLKPRIEFFEKDIKEAAEKASK